MSHPLTMNFQDLQKCNHNNSCVGVCHQICLTIGSVVANAADMHGCHCLVRASCPCSPISAWWDRNDGPTLCHCSHPGCIHQAHKTYPPKQHFLLLHVALADMWRQSRSRTLDCTPHKLAGQQNVWNCPWWFHQLHKDIHPGSPCSDELEVRPCLPGKCFLSLGGTGTWTQDIGHCCSAHRRQRSVHVKLLLHGPSEADPRGRRSWKRKRHLISENVKSVQSETLT